MPLKKQLGAPIRHFNSAISRTLLFRLVGAVSSVANWKNFLDRKFLGAFGFWSFVGWGSGFKSGFDLMDSNLSFIEDCMNLAKSLDFFTNSMQFFA